MANQIPTDVASQIIDQYPAFAPFMKIPEVAQLLIEASTPGQQWTTQKLQAAIQATNWWKQTSQPGRSWQVTQLTDPATAARTAAQTAVQVHQLAATEGIPLSADEVTFLTQDAMSNGWNAQQIQQNIANNASRKSLTAGTIQKTSDDLGGIAQSYGIPLAPATAFQWAQKIAAGTATQDGFTAWSQDQAKSLYPTLAKHIDQGMTVQQLANPYAQIAGQVLGVDPNSLDLSNPKWGVALQSRDAKTGEVVGPMSMSDWAQKLRSDPVYGYDHTVNAKLDATNLAQQLGQQMGFTS